MDTLDLSIRPVHATFPSGELKLWGNIWRPPVQRPCPIVIWNHSTGGLELPEFTGGTARMSTLELIMSLGFAVFAPARRGYDGSEGEPLQDLLARHSEFAPGTSDVILQRIQEESHDVVAAVDFVRSLDWVDPNGVYAFGHAFGALAALFASALTREIKGLVLFSTAARLWATASSVRDGATRAAANVNCPVLFLDSQNGYSQDVPAVTLVAEARCVQPTSRNVVYDTHGLTVEGSHDLFAFSDAWYFDVRDFLQNLTASTPVVLELVPTKVCCR